MNITLADFQIEAMSRLMEAMASDKEEIVLKSCTGSGKTIILTHFIDEYCKGHAKTVFVWLTPGKGSLEEQSKEKMDRYIHGSSTKLLSDVMTSGFEENDTCFINWEKLTKRGNNALKEGERTNFLEHIEKALDNGLSFKIIVDESHQNNTVKANDILQYFNTNKIIRSSATPKNYTNAYIIEIKDEDVIAEGLIKKVLIINENFEQNIKVENQISYLIDKALEKQQELQSAFLKKDIDINPLIIIQIPNKSKILQDQVERYLESKHLTYENQKLAVWLDKKKENIENISENNAEPIALIMKQAIATGWDCPRAHILIKLRDNMNETFEIQTIGRIRRMPEAKHYEDDLLDSCYLYTLDDKFTEGVRFHLGKGALNESILYLKSEHKTFKLTSEQKTGIPIARDAALALKVIHQYFEKTYKIEKSKSVNKTRLEFAGYIFNDNIIDFTKSGIITELKSEEIQVLNDISITEELNTHKHGQDYHHSIGEIGLKISLPYSQMNTIIRRLFSQKVSYSNKILDLETRNVYAFVINNKEKLKHDIQQAMAGDFTQLFKPNAISNKVFAFPQKCMFTYDATSKTQAEMVKNVYKGYLSSAEPRSASEKKFEKYCEANDNVDWFYKNGDKGPEYFSIVYEDNFGKQKLFYPDYIIKANQEIWIVETKGGFTRTGISEDIDLFSAKKFIVLKQYLNKYNLKGGFVREDKQSQELCICMDEYNDNIKSDNWKLLKSII